MKMKCLTVVCVSLQDEQSGWLIEGFITDNDTALDDGDHR